jgi:hypothetical protein
MSSRNRKVLAAALGIAFMLVGFVIAVFGQFLLVALGEALSATRAIPGFSVPDPTSNFYFYMVLAVCFAAGLSVTALLWSPRPGYSRRAAVYVLLLAVALPISLHNYAGADMLVNRSAQAIFNVLLVFVGSVVVAEIFSLSPSSRDLLVLQILAVLLLSMTTVLLPATFSIVWFLNAFGVVSETQSKSLGIPTISTICGVLSAVIAYLKFRRETQGIR